MIIGVILVKVEHSLVFYAVYDTSWGFDATESEMLILTCFDMVIFLENNFLRCTVQSQYFICVSKLDALTPFATISHPFIPFHHVLR